MTIEERVKKTVDELSKNNTRDAELYKLKEFYADMQRLGVAQKPTYTLPLPDTIGKQLYRMVSKH